MQDFKCWKGRIRTLTDGFGIHHAPFTPETLVFVPPQRLELRPDALEERCTSIIRKGQIKDDEQLYQESRP